jgi:uncharacterized membrane protein YphA (DoxX/SURF4 family)
MIQIEIKDKRDTFNTMWGILRIILGALLIWRGIYFIRDTFIFEHLINENSRAEFSKNEAWFMLLFALSVVIGGLFILIGCLTTAVSLFILPVFSIGTLFIHAGYVERNGFELIIIAIIMFLLLMFISRLNNRIINH